MPTRDEALQIVTQAQMLTLVKTIFEFEDDEMAAFEAIAEEIVITATRHPENIEHISQLMIESLLIMHNRMHSIVERCQEHDHTHEGE